MDETPRPLRSYGRMQGRKLRPRQDALAKTVLPALGIPLPEQGFLDPATLFDTPPRAVWLEIGFGGGEHLAAQAVLNPDVGFLGCEPYLNGVAKLLAEVEAQALRNIRVWRNDARDLIARLAARSVGRVFILFPDPWPKTKHQKRRLVSAETVASLARVMPDGAELRLASDHPGYVRAMRQVMAAQPWFLPLEAADESLPPPDWVRTRYQEKTEAQGRRAVFLIYRRTAVPAR